MFQYEFIIRTSHLFLLSGLYLHNKVVYIRNKTLQDFNHFQVKSNQIYVIVNKQFFPYEFLFMIM